MAQQSKGNQGKGAQATGGGKSGGGRQASRTRQADDDADAREDQPGENR
jgi:hypothetical protein